MRKYSTNKKYIQGLRNTHLRMSIEYTLAIDMFFRQSLRREERSQNRSTIL